MIKTIKSKLIGTQYEWDSTIDNVLRVFDKNLKYYLPKNILDVGCGRGDRTVHIANYFNVNTNNVYGLDYSNDFLSTCKDIFSVIKADLEFGSIPFDNNTFDLVICNQVLEHLKNFRKII